MALIESLDDSRVKKLKSLKYGANKPLVTKDINKTPSRQGLGLEASRRIDDLERMTKFFASPSGLKYLGNETLLNSIGIQDRLKKSIDSKLARRNERRDKKDKTPVPGTKIGNLIRGGAALLEDTLVNATNIVGSTLAQIPVNGTGTHFYRGFRNESTFYTANDDTKLVDLTSETVVSSEDSTTTIEDFRDGQRSYNFNKDGKNGYQRDEIRRESRVKLGNQAGRKNISSYTSELEPGTVDGINMLPPIELKPDESGNYPDRPGIGKDKGRDLIKFRFEIITPETERHTNTILYFRAFLDSFNDSYNGDWSKNNYLGRGEAFYTYGGFDRSINLGFKIAASTRHEMQPLYQKMVMLASSTAPTYSNNFMRGTLVKLTVGDYVYSLPGFLEQVNYTWQTDYPWEIAFQNPEGDDDDDMQELPHVLDCQVNFRPIHNFTPQTGLYHYITNEYPGGGSARFFNIGGSTSPKPASAIINSSNEKEFKLKSQQQLDNE